MKRALPTPENVQLVINAGGDSYTHNRSRWIQGFTEYLVSKFGDAGGGWCGFGFLNSGNVAPWTTGNQPSFLNGNARSTYPTKVFGNRRPLITAVQGLIWPLLPCRLLAITLPKTYRQALFITLATLCL